MGLGVFVVLCLVFLVWLFLFRSFLQGFMFCNDLNLYIYKVWVAWVCTRFTRPEGASKKNVNRMVWVIEKLRNWSNFFIKKEQKNNPSGEQPCMHLFSRSLSMLLHIIWCDDY